MYDYSSAGASWRACLASEATIPWATTLPLAGSEVVQRRVVGGWMQAEYDEYYFEGMVKKKVIEERAVMSRPCLLT